MSTKTAQPRVDKELKAAIAEYAEAGTITLKQAKALWTAALDGPGVTQGEFRTLRQALENSEYKFATDARTYLTNLVTESTSGKSQYKTINKIKYDRSVLDKAVHLTKDGALSLADAKLLWAEVEDGPGVTETEKRSIEYIMANNRLTAGATSFFEAQLKTWVAPKRKRAAPATNVASPDKKVRTDTSLVLYGYWRSSCSWRVRIALALKGLDFENRPVHLVNNGGEQHSEEHKARNPMESVPTLALPDGRYISQSLAILDYLEEKYPEVPLLPTDLFERAKVRQLAQIIACDTQPIQNLRVLLHVVTIDAKAKMPWGAHWIMEGLKAFETEVAATAGEYSFGDHVTIADLCLVPQLYNARRFSCDLTGLPTVLRIEANLKKLPAFQAADPANQPDAQ
jgi:maleylacetoacetate isomerase